MVHVFSLTKVTSMNFLTLLLHIRTTLPTTYIYAGDFNAYTAKEIECHITPLDSHTLFHRTGDTNPAHSPASPPPRSHCLRPGESTTLATFQGKANTQAGLIFVFFSVSVFTTGLVTDIYPPSPVLGVFLISFSP